MRKKKKKDWCYKPGDGLRAIYVKGAPEQLKTQLENFAKNKGTTVSAEARKFIREGLDKVPEELKKTPSKD